MRDDAARRQCHQAARREATGTEKVMVPPNGLSWYRQRSARFHYRRRASRGDDAAISRERDLAAMPGRIDGARRRPFRLRIQHGALVGFHRRRFWAAIFAAFRAWALSRRSQASCWLRRAHLRAAAQNALKTDCRPRCLRCHML